MKKLMIALAAAATTMFSFGDLPTGTSFEDLQEGPMTVGDIVDKTDDGSAVGDYYWYSTATATDELGVITNDVAGAGVSRPDMFAKQNQANTKSLQVDTTAPLFRTALSNSGATGVTPVVIGDGIYLDTLVKFTPSDEEFKDGALEANVDKIAIAYVEHGEESLDTNDPTDTPFTNFVIRAGYIGTSAISQKNYRAYLPDDPTLENFDKDAWHRLTVRAIANIGGNNVGFIVYLDQKPLAYDGPCGDNFSPSTDAQNYYNDEIHAVYPSAVNANITGGDQIAAVAFSGNGSIDDVVFTTETPEFITASESVVVPFVADAGVTAISVLPDGATDAILVDMTADTLSAQLPAQTTDFTVTATIDTVGGYEFGSMTVGDAVYNTNPASVTGYTGGDITITTIRNNFNLFDENGDPIQGTFQTLTEAFAEDGVAMIKLAYDYDALAFEGEDFDGYDIDGEIVLDLNGNDLDGGDDSAGVSLFRVADTLTIKDSVGGGSITYDTQYGYAIVQNDGSDVFIGAASGDAGATFNGKLFEDGYEGAIIKGNIDNANNADEGVFLWDGYVDDDSEYELVGDYWVVTPQGGGDEDWKDPSEITKDATAGEVYGITGDLAAADAVELTEWATGVGSVTFANKDTINIDCFLLNIANNSTAEKIQDEKDEFVVNISFDSVTGEPVVTAPTGKTYNGKLIIKGSDDLSIPKANWDEQTDGDTFFYGELSL